jgi:hypothetical protein
MHINEALAFQKHGKTKKGLNLHKVHTILKILGSGSEVGITIDATGLTHGQAITLERETIASIGRNDLGLGPLTNLRDGGEGGTNPSSEIREKISKANRGRVVSEATRERQSHARQGRVISPEWRENISKGSKGRPHSDEHNTKVGRATKRRWSEDHVYRQKMVGVHVCRWRVLSPDQTETVIENLTEFARQHGLGMPSLSQSGIKGKPYKGYMAFKLDR